MRILIIGKMYGDKVLEEGYKYCQFLIHAGIMSLDLQHSFATLQFPIAAIANHHNVNGLNKHKYFLTVLEIRSTKWVSRG